MELLLNDGALLAYHDAYVPEVTLGKGIFSRRGSNMRLESVKLTGDALEQAGCVLVTVAHGAYDFEWIIGRARLAVDSVNATKQVAGCRDHAVLI